jgi:glycerophosphoryl diester phosphodiesterase
MASAAGVLAARFVALPLALLFAGDASATLLMYHRGGQAFGPENTVAAIDLAFRDGGETIEIDVGGTLDQVLVLMHDLTVDRTTNGTGLVTSLTLAEIKQLDAGFWFGSGEFTGEPVPTLVEALDVIRAYGGQVLLDRRPGSTSALIAAALAEAQVAHGDAWVFETSLQQVAILEAALPGVRIIFVPLPGVVFDQAFLDTLAAAGVWGVSLTMEELFTQTFVDMLHAVGLSAFRLEAIRPRPESLQSHLHALTIGVDVLDTSSPDVYREALLLVPEPSSLALAAVGLAVLAGLRQRPRGRGPRGGSAFEAV